MKRTTVGRADLVRLLSEDLLDPQGAARLLGYFPRRREVEQVVRPESIPAPEFQQVAREKPSPGRAARAFGIPFWRPLSVRFRTAEEEKAHRPLSRAELSEPPKAETPPARLPLLQWSRLGPTLRKALRSVDIVDLDCDWFVRQASRGEPLRELRYRLRERWAPRLMILLDRSAPLAPFWEDQDQLIRILRQCSGPGMELRVLPEGPRGPVFQKGVALPRGLEDLLPGQVVLGLTDLGFYGADSDRMGWLRLGRVLSRSGVCLRSLVPCPKDRWVSEIASIWGASLWDRPSGSNQDLEESELSERVTRLLTLLSPAVRVEAGLLRAARLLSGATEFDVGTEADVWQEASRANGMAMSLSREKRDAALLEFFALEEGRRREMAGVLRRWHSSVPREIWFEEVLTLARDGEEARALGLNRDRDQAIQLFLRLAVTVERGGLREDEEKRFIAWCERVESRIPPEARVDEQVDRALGTVSYQIHQRRRDAELSGRARIPPDDVEPRWMEVRHGSEGLRIGGRGDSYGSPVGRLWVGGRVFVRSGSGRRMVRHDVGDDRFLLVDRVTEITLDTGHSSMRLGVFKRPDWATAIGRDRFGLWTEFEVKGVSHRLRWIPPGRFTMGSPEGERGRHEREGPQHQVTISEGFWIGETPCTQDLWEIVMGSNPSEFVSPDRPVDSVSWHESSRFLEKLDRVSGASSFRLPTEAEWEYACRAGTKTSIYAGELEILGPNNAPLLDKYAWYGGNSGVEFDLKEGWDSSRWEEKQHEHKLAGTRKVKAKNPNLWGLCDILGNLWEWCSDWMAEYPNELLVDPKGPSRGTLRVLRGGSWSSDAGLVRAAARVASVPVSRDASCGFRLVRGQGA